MDNQEDVFFLHSLLDYHQRREEALGYAMISDLLLSLRSTILFLSSVSVIESIQKLTEGTELHGQAMNNRKKIDRLSRKIKQSKSIKRQRTWYRVILRLHEEILQAEFRMKELADG